MINAIRLIMLFARVTVGSIVLELTDLLTHHVLNHIVLQMDLKLHKYNLQET